MFCLRIFRFRSPVLDRATDERRVALIQKVVRSAEAEAEAKGLRASISRLRRSAIFLVEQVDDGEPDPSRRAELTTFEKHLIANERRLAQLKDHLAALRSIELAAARMPN
jgi:hypothetical protein